MSRVSSRNGVLGSALRVLFVLLTQFSKFIHALPLHTAHGPQLIKTHGFKKSDSMTSEQFYINMLVSVFLVLLGGCFAGLTLALMGQDEVYLQVMVSSGDKQERYYAAKVLQLIKRGKHWVLVTLLLSNVVTNETLPIVLDRCLGGGWPAVVTSTASIVIFGEIIPQSVSVRYGLQVGAAFAPFVLVLMYVLYPIAFPVALLLDYLLGEDHGTLYKKSGLKTLVTLHRTMGVERLNQDEVTIISAVLDLKEKPVSHIMTPMDRVYTMSADTLLDEKTVEEIFNAGFSRIPIHLPGEPSNFIGMLLVRVLISYDPEDAFPVASFPLATLPETATDTSCLNILNYFQEGKSHMIVVSEHPGEPTGAIGVLTLEDVIEELIGEEIVDESDVYIDINKNIKRLNPGPLSKRNLSYYLHNLYSGNSSKRNSIDNPQLTPLKESFDHELPAPNRAGAASPKNDVTFNWKPINPASNPLDVNKSFVTIKRPNFETVKNQVAETQGTLGQYGSTRGEDTLNGKARANGKYGRKFLLPDERESDVSEIRENGDEQLISLGQGDLFEERLYRTGGIIESVINVQGVHKTIIENVSEDNGSSDDESSQSRPEQLMIDDGEEHRLLNRQSSFSLHSGKTN